MTIRCYSHQSYSPSSADESDELNCIGQAALDMTLKQRSDAHKHIVHSKELLGTLNKLAGGFGVEINEKRRAFYKSKSISRVSNVTTVAFNDELNSSKRVVKFDHKTEAESAKPSRYHRIPNVESKVDAFIESQELSSDKMVAVNIVRNHFRAILTGEADASDYEAPFLLICGKPGNGKSKLVETFDGIASIMKVGEQMKCAYMGSAAVNIDGTTLLKRWNIPVFNDHDKKEFGPWDPTKLLELKNMFGGDVHRMCCVVLDEVSTVQPYMLACLNARMQELFQMRDKIFGGRMVILLGDFEQKPPTAGGRGNTLPGAVMEPIEKRYQPLTEKRARELGPTQMGGYLFSKATYIKLTSQHRSGDSAHTKVLDRMSRRGIITAKTLRENYQLLNGEDLLSEEFAFAPIVVTGNNERREINAWQAERWAKYHGVNIVRWARIRRENTWKGKPRTFKATAHAMENSCFWELFIPGAKAYLNTYGINADNGLANGTEVRYHSLSFQCKEDEHKLQAKLLRARPGETITIADAPSAINVELFAGDSKRNKTMREKWLKEGNGSITNDGYVVIPISIEDGNKIPYKTSYIPGCYNVEEGYYYDSSKIDMKDYFPCERDVLWYTVINSVILVCFCSSIMSLFLTTSNSGASV